MGKTEVMVLGTLHGMHQNNNFYSFDKIFEVVDEFSPKVVGVEIRQEDMEQSREYLSKFYPYEMIEAIERYGNKIGVKGFDWLGESIEGKLIPEDYFVNLELKKLEKEFSSSSEHKREKEIIECINKARMSLLINKTCDEIHDGKYDIVGELYYSQLDVILKDTPYQAMSEFYRKRDVEIGKRMIDIVNENKGERIIFLTGLDHRVFANKTLKEHFGEEVVLVNP